MDNHQLAIKVLGLAEASATGALGIGALVLVIFVILGGRALKLW